MPEPKKAAFGWLAVQPACTIRLRDPRDKMIHTGRHFLQIPGPTNVPDRVLRAMDHPVIDHRSAEFANLGAEVLEGVRMVFQTAQSSR